MTDPYEYFYLTLAMNYILVLCARDLIFFTTNLQTVNYYTTIHC